MAFCFQALDLDLELGLADLELDLDLKMDLDLKLGPDTSQVVLCMYIPTLPIEVCTYIEPALSRPVTMYVQWVHCSGCELELETEIHDTSVGEDVENVDTVLYCTVHNLALASCPLSAAVAAAAEGVGVAVVAVAVAVVAVSW